MGFVCQGQTLVDRVVGDVPDDLLKAFEDREPVHFGYMPGSVDGALRIAHDERGLQEADLDIRLQALFELHHVQGAFGIYGDTERPTAAMSSFSPRSLLFSRNALIVF